MNAASLIQAVRDRFPAAVTASHSFRGDATAIVSREFLLEVARSLKEDAAFQMNFLMDLTAVDFSAFGTKPSRGILFLVRRGGASLIRKFPHTIRGPALPRTPASPSSTTSSPCRSSTGCEWRCFCRRTIRKWIP